MTKPPLPIKAVLFDLDNTLYDREAAFGQWAQMFVRDHLRLDEVRQKEVLGDIRAWDTDGYGSKKTIFERLVVLYPELRDGMASSVDLFYDQFIAQMSLDTAAEQLLDALARNAMPFGVVTNGEARQWHKIERFGLRRRTPCLFVSGTFGSKKPEPAIFRAAADCLEVPTGNVLFIGDHPIADVQGASGAGMQTAWLHRGLSWPEKLGQMRPDYCIDGLGDFLAENILGLSCVSGRVG